MTSSTYRVPALTLGWRLRMSLEFAGIKADDMAARLGVHRGTVTRWTHEVGAAPRRVYLEKWAAETGVPLGWLLGDEEVDTNKATGGITHRYEAHRELANAAA